MLKTIPLPEYVTIEDSSCVLKREGSEYFRDAGGWGVSYIIDHDGIIRINEPTGIAKHLHNKILFPSTRENYMEDNKGYV